MSKRWTLRSQVEKLKCEKERLEVENACLKDSDANLHAKLDCLHEENEWLREEAGSVDASHSDKCSEAGLLLEQQRQPYEDLQAELAEASTLGDDLEDRCRHLEDQLQKALEESELERLKTVDAVRTKYKDTFVQQIQEL